MAGRLLLPLRILIAVTVLAALLGTGTLLARSERSQVGPVTIPCPEATDAWGYRVSYDDPVSVALSADAIVVARVTEVAPALHVAWGINALAASIEVERVISSNHAVVDLRPGRLLRWWIHSWFEDGEWTCSPGELAPNPGVSYVLAIHASSQKDVSAAGGGRFGSLAFSSRYGSNEANGLGRFSRLTEPDLVRALQAMPLRAAGVLTVDLEAVPTTTSTVFVIDEDGSALDRQFSSTTSPGS